MRKQQQTVREIEGLLDVVGSKMRTLRGCIDDLTLDYLCSNFQASAELIKSRVDAVLGDEPAEAQQKAVWLN